MGALHTESDMPATALTVTQLSHKTSINVTIADTPGTNGDNVNGNSVSNGGTTILLANNTGGASATLTVAFASTVDGQAITSVTHTIPAGKVHVIKLGPPSLYGSSTILTPSASTLKLQAYSI